MDFCDSYNHLDPNLIYTQENIPTREFEDEFNQQFVHCCECPQQCTPEGGCVCVKNSGAFYFFPAGASDYYADFVITVKDADRTILECNANCKCYGTSCGNRLVQFGPRNNLKITPASAAKKGLSLITTEFINKGSFICEYAGEIITKDEAIKRHQKAGMNYIFCINENFGQTRTPTYIDPSKIGNIGRYLNHSCKPNCQLIPIRVDNTIPKLCIFAVDDIEANVELTFDYGTDNSLEETVDRIKCLCASNLCRNFLPFTNYT